MAFHPSHRIFVRFGFRATGSNVDKRIIRHHAFIHPVESQRRTIRRPESPFMDTELVLMNGLPANNTFSRFVRHDTDSVIRRKDFQVVLLRKSQITIGRTKVEVLPGTIQIIHAYNPVFHKIVMETMVLGIKSKHRLIFVRNREEGHTANRLRTGHRKRFVQLLASKGNFHRLCRFSTHHAVTLDIQICVFTPLQLFQVARHKTTLRLSTGNQVMQSKLFVLSHHRQRIYKYQST